MKYNQFISQFALHLKLQMSALGKTDLFLHCSKSVWVLYGHWKPGLFFVLTWVLMKKGGSDTGGIMCNVSEWNVQTGLVN